MQRIPKKMIIQNLRHGVIWVITGVLVIIFLLGGMLATRDYPLYVLLGFPLVTSTILVIIGYHLVLWLQFVNWLLDVLEDRENELQEMRQNERIIHAKDPQILSEKGLPVRSSREMDTGSQ